ncbi:MAG: transporter associated domain-containing protein [Spongiibacteraceae bacterium]|jgi:magnesium and cobalt transporter|nr:transporter associated domain-containing protein [Spongiibacteraceae bacterium]
MSDDRSSRDPGEKTWIEKIANAFSTEPRTREDLMEVLRGAQEGKLIDAEALSIIEGAMQVGDLQVRELMIPRTRMEVIRIGQALEEFLPMIIDTGHSRYPVVGETVDEVQGVLLAKDLLPLLLKDSGPLDLKTLLRPATVVPESKRVTVLLREFRENRNHMAIVIDEYGGVAGLITIEDILEEIVGDIEDEYDEDEDAFIKQVAEDDWLVQALTPIDEFNEEFGTAISDEEFDTIGGIILQRFGHLPRRNEETVIEGYSFKVINADNRQIHLLRMRPAAQTS